MFTPRAGNVKSAVVSAVVTAALFVAIARVEKKPVEWSTVKLWALGSFYLMFLAGL